MMDKYAHYALHERGKYRVGSRKTVNLLIDNSLCKESAQLSAKSALMKRLAVINWRNLIGRLHRSLASNLEYIRTRPP